MSAPLLEAMGLCRSYASGRQTIQVLDQLELSVHPGETCAIVGASGSGKTTLLQILGTLDAPDKGELRFHGQDLLGQGEVELARFRNQELGFIFQFHHLLPEFSVLENTIMPGLLAGRSHSELEGAAKKLLTQVELDQRLDHRVGELSGGEQQRCALARALIMEPALLLADEPTGNLDSRSGHLVFDLLTRLCRARGMAVLMVSHNLELARAMDRCLTLSNGQLHQSP